MARDAETRRACVPACAMRPNYAGRNRTAPDFELEDVKGGKVRLSEYRGKTVVLNFWTTTCQPCLEEMPSIAELAKVLEARRAKALPHGVRTSCAHRLDRRQQRDRDDRAENAAARRERPAVPVLLDPESSVGPREIRHHALSRNLDHRSQGGHQGALRRWRATGPTPWCSISSNPSSVPHLRRSSSSRASPRGPRPPSATSPDRADTG